MSAKILVVSGTDTEVGKTFVGAALCRHLAATGLKVIAVKPVESGVAGEPSPGEDGCILAESTLQEEPRHALQRLKAPLAPPVAAELEKVQLEFARWVGTIRGYARSADVVVVEGAGGLLSPLTWQETALSLAEKLDASVMLVAADRLGSLNHTLLSVRAIEATNVKVTAVVFSAPLDSDRSTGRNAASFARITGFPRIATVPAMAHWDTASSLMGNVAAWLLDE